MFSLNIKALANKHQTSVYQHLIHAIWFLDTGNYNHLATGYQNLSTSHLVFAYQYLASNNLATGY